MPGDKELIFRGEVAVNIFPSGTESSSIVAIAVANAAVARLPGSGTTRFVFRSRSVLASLLSFLWRCEVHAGLSFATIASGQIVERSSMRHGERARSCVRVNMYLLISNSHTRLQHT